MGGGATTLAEVVFGQVGFGPVHRPPECANFSQDLLPHWLDDKAGANSFGAVELVEDCDLVALIGQQAGRCQTPYSGPDDGEAHGVNFSPDPENTDMVRVWFSYGFDMVGYGFGGVIEMAKSSRVADAQGGAITPP